ncbi:sigma-70 family RNA polymerase sigma factor [Bacillus sp. CGMCC 1.16607]|uniref:sigma-70 family RNA polymerase sigma factor n=1 Tax=Bacillus sp. CGMCC 1.16607 TaxID=3351842 RepID=UPI00363C3036
MENFEQLLSNYEPMIYKIIRSLNIYKNHQEFYQLGLIGLWEASNRFNPTKGNFTNYAYTYIKGLFLTEMNRSKKHEERTVRAEEDFWELIEDTHFDDSITKKQLLPFCKYLTDNQKKWLFLTCVSSLSVKEIAEKENVSLSAVKNWRAGAREKLRVVMNK